MQTESILVSEFCRHHNIELTFVRTLGDSGLIEITTEREELFVPISQLERLERMTRLHYEMDINVEGIETIDYLLEKIKTMQREMAVLSNRLQNYSEE